MNFYCSFFFQMTDDKKEDQSGFDGAECKFMFKCYFIIKRISFTFIPATGFTTHAFKGTDQTKTEFVNEKEEGGM